MPDPLALPLELWAWCVAFAIDGRQDGPLELLAVSRRWERALLDTPSLWNQIYVQNGEDEIARIAVFLHLSRGCSLHVDIMTALPDMDGLQMIADNISRVTTISIRPSPSDTITASDMDRWKQVAAYNLAKLSNGLVPSDVKCTLCLGMSLMEYNQWYYCIILMHFTMVATVANTDRQNRPSSVGLPVKAHHRLWEEYISRTTRISADQDFNDRTISVSSLVRLASYPQHQDAIGIAIPSCIKLLEDHDRSIRSATVEALHKLAVHIKLREALGLATPSLITLLENNNSGVVKAAVSLLGELADRGELHEAMMFVIPTLLKLFEHGIRLVMLDAVSLFGKLTEHDELHEPIKFAIPGLIMQLEHKHFHFRSAAVSLVGKLVKYDVKGEFLGTLGLTIPSLVNLLEHSNSDLRSVAVSLLGKLGERDELHEAIRLTIPSIIKLLEYKTGAVGLDVSSIFGNVTGHENFLEASARLVFTAPLENNNSGVVLAAISLFEKLAEHGKLHEALSFTIPSLIELLGCWHKDVQLAAVSLLGKLAEHDELHEALGIVIPSLIKLLEHRYSGVRSVTFSLLGKLAEHNKYHEALRLTTPSLIKLLEHWDSGIRSPADSLLKKLAEADE